MGLSRQLESADALWSMDWAGTPTYMAPEIDRFLVKKTSKSEPHGLKADVWSLGVLIKEIGKNLKRNEDVAQLVQCACVEDSSSRPTATQLREKLSSLSAES